jgi:transmembrane sensor
MTEDLDPGLAQLTDYVSGECSSDERAFLERRIAEDPAYAAVAETLRVSRQAVQVAASEEAAVDRVVSQVLARVHSAPRPAVERRHVRSTWRRMLLPLGVAAAIVGVAFTFGRNATLSPGNRPSEFFEHVTAPGQRATLTLADGSTVTLNVGTRLRYAKNFGRTSRDVYVDGEALFTVPHHTGVPFVVHASAPVRVLGTVFSVRQYAGERARVIVAQGRVSMGDAVVTTGQAATTTTDGRTVVTPDANTAAALAWVDGRLVIDAQRLGDVIPELNRWLGWDIRLADPALAERRLTTQFSNESSRQALAELGALLHARVEQHGSVVTVFSK